MDESKSADLKARLRTQWDSLAADWIASVGTKGGNDHREGLLDTWML